MLRNYIISNMKAIVRISFETTGVEVFGTRNHYSIIDFKIVINPNILFFVNVFRD